MEKFGPTFMLFTAKCGGWKTGVICRFMMVRLRIFRFEIICNRSIWNEVETMRLFRWCIQRSLMAQGSMWSWWLSSCSIVGPRFDVVFGWKYAMTWVSFLKRRLVDWYYVLFEIVSIMMVLGFPCAANFVQYMICKGIGNALKLPL